MVRNLIHALVVLETHRTDETNEIAIGEISILGTDPDAIRAKGEGAGMGGRLIA